MGVVIKKVSVKKAFSLDGRDAKLSFDNLFLDSLDFGLRIKSII